MIMNIQGAGPGRWYLRFTNRGTIYLLLVSCSKLHAGLSQIQIGGIGRIFLLSYHYHEPYLITMLWSCLLIQIMDAFVTAFRTTDGMQVSKYGCEE